MAVNVGQRNVPDTNANRKSDAVDKCQHLCRHVLNLTANSKVLECPHADVAQRVRDLATDECYRSWKAHAKHGNSYQLLAKLDEYYNSLKRRAQYA